MSLQIDCDSSPKVLNLELTLLFSSKLAPLFDLKPPPGVLGEFISDPPSLPVPPLGLLNPSNPITAAIAASSSLFFLSSCNFLNNSLTLLLNRSTVVFMLETFEFALARLPNFSQTSFPKTFAASANSFLFSDVSINRFKFAVASANTDAVCEVDALFAAKLSAISKTCDALRFAVSMSSSFLREVSNKS